MQDGTCSTTCTTFAYSALLAWPFTSRLFKSHPYSCHTVSLPEKSDSVLHKIANFSPKCNSPDPPLYFLILYFFLCHPGGYTSNRPATGVTQRHLSKGPASFGLQKDQRPLASATSQGGPPHWPIKIRTINKPLNLIFVVIECLCYLYLSCYSPVPHTRGQRSRRNFPGNLLRCSSEEECWPCHEGSPHLPLQAGSSYYTGNSVQTSHLHEPREK